MRLVLFSGCRSCQLSSFLMSFVKLNHTALFVFITADFFRSLEGAKMRAIWGRGGGGLVALHKLGDVFPCVHWSDPRTRLLERFRASSSSILPANAKSLLSFLFSVPVYFVVHNSHFSSIIPPYSFFIFCAYPTLIFLIPFSYCPHFFNIYSSLFPFHIVHTSPFFLIPFPYCPLLQFLLFIPFLHFALLQHHSSLFLFHILHFFAKRNYSFLLLSYI